MTPSAWSVSSSVRASSARPASSASTASLVRWRIPRRWRQLLLIIHIISGVGWIGIDFALLPLVITGLTTDDGVLTAACYRAVAVLVPWSVPALSLLIVVSGVLLGLTSTWGLVRYWWVAIKLAISMLLSTLVFVALLPAVSSLKVPAATSGDEVRAALADPAMYLFPPIVSGLLLTFAAILSVTKPWGRLRRRSV